MESRFDLYLNDLPQICHQAEQGNVLELHINRQDFLAAMYEDPIKSRLYERAVRQTCSTGGKVHLFEDLETSAIQRYSNNISVANA